MNLRLSWTPPLIAKRLAEAGVSEGAMLDIMGHVSRAMLRRYLHVRARARRDAMKRAESQRYSLRWTIPSM